MMATQQLPPPDPALPANIECEAQLLGALMMHNPAVDVVADKLRAEHFFEPVHGRIYEAILREASLGRTANPVTLRPYFEGDEALQQVGGPAYLASLTGSGAGLIAVRDFSQQVRELAQLRNLIAVAREIEADALDTGADLEAPKKIERAISRLHEIVDGEQEGVREVSAAEAVRLAVEPEDSGLGVLSGIDSLDSVLGPIKPPQMIICAGRPGMGKTILGLNYARGVARRDGELSAATTHEVPPAVLFVTQEMGAQELGERLAADLSFDGHGGINYGVIENHRLSTEQARQLCRLANEVEDLPLAIHDAPGMTVGRLAAVVRRWKRRFAARGCRLALVVVDYLQLLSPDRDTENRTQDITKVSMACKRICKANDVGMLALAQLSRALEQREDKRPRLSDLRESGQIEQDADGVLFLHRPEYYLRQSEPDEDSPDRAKWEQSIAATSGVIEFIVAKRRGRPTGISRGRFHGAFQAVR